MGQLVLRETVLVAPSSNFARPLLIPAACALISIILLLLHVIFTAQPVKRYVAKLRGRTVTEDDEPPQPIIRQHTGFFPDLRSHIEGHGGGAIFAWKILRLLACITLTVLTIVAINSINEGHKTIGMNDVNWDTDILGKKHKKPKKRARWFSTAEWIEISLCLFYVSTGVLLRYLFI